MDIHRHWEEKSKDGVRSGTVDLIIDRLEQEAILSEVINRENMLEVGCGDGRNAINIAKRTGITTIDAFDFSRGMIKFAKQNAKKENVENINFFSHSICDLKDIDKQYDLIISKRALINLLSYGEQIEAIQNISRLLRKGGVYLMCESSLDGLRNINRARRMLSLPEIKMPWHNKYFEESKLEEDVGFLKLEKKKCFSSLYYFLSRVVNAFHAKAGGLEPQYDSAINRVALKLNEDNFTQYAQVVLWVWRNVK